MQLAFVLLRNAALPQAEAVVAALRSIAPLVASDVSMLPAEPARSLALRVGAVGELSVTLMDGPVPDGEADAKAPFSASTLSTGWRPDAHRAHAVVAFKEGDSDDLATLERLRLFTFLLAAVVETADCVGVYWGSARATHEPRFFVEVARVHDVLPLMLWTGVQAERDGPGRSRLLSTAMDHLELPDLLLSAGVDGPEEPLEFFFELLSYAAQRGAAPSEGEIVGRTAEEQIPVRYVPSPTRPTERVWSVTTP